MRTIKSRILIMVAIFALVGCGNSDFTGSNKRKSPKKTKERDNADAVQEELGDDPEDEVGIETVGLSAQDSGHSYCRFEIRLVGW